jgi:hypothetical protein
MAMIMQIQCMVSSRLLCFRELTCGLPVSQCHTLLLLEGELQGSNNLQNGQFHHTYQNKDATCKSGDDA